MKLPNVRKLFVPDPGNVIADVDLDRADLQVVVWEAGDKDLKQMLREGADIHSENAKTLGISRQLAKSWVHGTNYGGSPFTMARTCGVTVKEAERMQRRWFAAHPGIHQWHRRTEESLMRTREVRNRFGFRRYYFDRIESVLPQALAWIPQSTVANVINIGWQRVIEKLYPEVEVLLQVHDSLVLQWSWRKDREIRPKVRDALLVEIPYEDPLTIPVGLKTSLTSWGDCKEVKWVE